MQTRFRLAAWAVVLGLGLTVIGCGRYSYGYWKAKMRFREANVLYQQQDYRRAAAKYEEVVAASPELPPDLVAAYFFLGNSYDNLYQPSHAGEAENDAYLQKAVENYKNAAERETDPKIKKLALEYLVAAYGADKLNDPSQAEPIVKQMIAMEPNEPTYYFWLAKIYEDSGMYEEAEQTLLKAREVRPNDPTVYTTLAGYYNRQGEFEKTIEAFEERARREPENPEAFQTIAAFYWEKAFRDFRLPDKLKQQYVEQGLKVVDQALTLKQDYLEALAFKNLLLREKAKFVKDRKEYDALIAEANRLQQRVLELQKKKAAGVGE